MARVTFGYINGSFSKAFADDYQKMATAGTLAITEVANQAKAAGRANIAAAGFGPKWQNALRAEIYPKRGVSLNAAAVIFHKIPYSEIFEEGGTIAGHPLLWLPIEANLPARSGLRSWTPRAYAAQVGPLVSVNVPGRRPMLFAATRGGPRRRRGGGRRDVPKPLFVGIDAVTMTKRFNITQIVRDAAARLPEVYAAKLKTL
ncbi:DUF6441 family protein [Bradyrhizobium sp. RDM4]|uniref:DUF6441 family protein n=1 Tax=Bradyrhizobium sp. RDM4 TaxID=3378765 RepID=UPI0038FD0CF0